MTCGRARPRRRDDTRAATLRPVVRRTAPRPALPRNAAACEARVAAGFARRGTTIAIVSCFVAIAVGCGHPTIGPGALPAHSSLAPDDPLYEYQWGMRLLDVENAWGLLSASGSRPSHPSVTATVAVIDSGIAASHPDLADRLALDGYDFVERSPLPRGVIDPAGSVEHGTHVAGIVGAEANEGVGVAGIGGVSPATAYRTKLTSLKVLADATDIAFSGGTFSDLAAALLYAVGIPNDTGSVASVPARVINMSLGAEVDDVSTWEAAVVEAACAAAEEAGALLVAAAGNGNPATQQGVYGGIDIPAVFDSVVAVGSCDGDGSRSSFSDYGPELELLAPGGSALPADGGILTVSTGLPGRNPDGYGAGYSVAEGTSVATPFVSGVAALVALANPYLTGRHIRSILRATARDVGPAGFDEETGHGIVDAYEAVALALSRPYGPYASRAGAGGRQGAGDRAGRGNPLDSGAAERVSARLRRIADEAMEREPGLSRARGARDAPTQSEEFSDHSAGSPARGTGDIHEIVLVFDPVLEPDVHRLAAFGVRPRSKTAWITRAVLSFPVATGSFEGFRAALLVDPAILIVAADARIGVR